MRLNHSGLVVEQLVEQGASNKSSIFFFFFFVHLIVFFSFPSFICFLLFLLLLEVSWGLYVTEFSMLLEHTKKTNLKISELST